MIQVLTMKGQVFTHIDDDGTVRHFNVDALLAFVKKNTWVAELIDIPLTDHWIDFVEKNRGIEEHRVTALLADVDAMSQPALACFMPDETTLSIDGHHRMVARWRSGRKTMPTYLIEERIWSLGLIETGMDETTARRLIGQ